MASIALTTAGVEAAWRDDGTGLGFSISHFKLGSSIGFLPTRTTREADLGTIVYGQDNRVLITSVTRISSQQSEFRILLDTSVGPFDFGCIGLYLNNGPSGNAGTLFATIVLDRIFNKVINQGTELGNSFRIHIPIRFNDNLDALTILTETDPAPAKIVEVSDVEGLGAAGQYGTGRSVQPASAFYEFDLPGTVPADGAVVATLPFRATSVESIADDGTALEVQDPNTTVAGLRVAGNSVIVERTAGVDRYLNASAAAVNGGSTIRVGYRYSPAQNAQNVYLVQDLNILAYAPVDINNNQWSFSGYHHIGDITIARLGTSSSSQGRRFLFSVQVDQTVFNEMYSLSDYDDYIDGDLIIQTKTDAAGNDLLVGAAKRIDRLRRNTSFLTTELNFTNSGGPIHNMAVGDTIAVYLRTAVQQVDLEGYATEAWVRALQSTTSARGLIEIAEPQEYINNPPNDKAATPAGVSAAITARTATTGRAGIVELATDGEHTQNNPPSNRAATPSGVEDAISARTATTSRRGIVELAAWSEHTQNNPPSDKAATPGGVVQAIAARTATTTRPGIVEFATNAEHTQGSPPGDRAATPSGVADAITARAASTSAAGIVELATDGEHTQSNPPSDKAATPSGVEDAITARRASLTQAGIVELATDDETTDTAPGRGRATTPAGVQAAIAAHTATTERRGVIEIATDAEHTQSNPPNDKAATPRGVAAVISTQTGSNIVLATNAEHTQANPPNNKAASPSGVSAAITARRASLTQAGIVELATDDETTDPAPGRGRATTPAGVQALIDTKAASDSEHTQTNPPSDKLATPAGVAAAISARTATTRRAGIVQYATNDEHTQTNPPSNKAATPAGISAALGDNIATNAEHTQSNPPGNKAASPAGVSAAITARTASLTQAGIVELATDDETTDTAPGRGRATTPAGVQAAIRANIATDAEHTQANPPGNKAASPTGVIAAISGYSATTRRAGVVAYATSGEHTQASPPSNKAATPSGVAAAITARTASTSAAGIIELATDAEHTQASPPTDRAATPSGVAAAISAGTTVSGLDTILASEITVLNDTRFTIATSYPLDNFRWIEFLFASGMSRKFRRTDITAITTASATRAYVALIEPTGNASLDIYEIDTTDGELTNRRTRDLSRQGVNYRSMGLSQVGNTSYLFVCANTDISVLTVDLANAETNVIGGPRGIQPAHYSGIGMTTRGTTLWSLRASSTGAIRIGPRRLSASEGAPNGGIRDTSYLDGAGVDTYGNTLYAILLSNSLNSTKLFSISTSDWRFTEIGVHNLGSGDWTSMDMFAGTDGLYAVVFNNTNKRLYTFVVNTATGALTSRGYHTLTGVGTIQALGSSTITTTSIQTSGITVDDFSIDRAGDSSIGFKRSRDGLNQILQVIGRK